MNVPISLIPSDTTMNVPVPLLPSAATPESKDIMIGNMPLSLFIPICIFGPMLCATLVHLYVKKSRQVDREMDRQRHGGDVEMQLREFLGVREQKGRESVREV
ncbi:hypothetical protein COCC4DRAFT_146662 [Bipolaris maydis ATCC 48331]|uniref:Uncharacterized protein n=2 Tax=Cochliobolus heterostrophus TaxID=5016 RepID=M2UDL3_COCH5|nr:uncharacterized protein COCC4DRAFT_146662 [Bipolaris maydis ATCC 48331]EMD86078.1 hypothetical protein COCHEDRAFT_1161007 [Bipolaris maydis C5]ENI02081.1 hypothetical protein COCC4DRAFT_146662 [Bipolaris maydis ATCC 48331]KAH7562768.1 hypothetical protein BM1_02288 [Bipolaris maydis]KAJ6203892.1 hypothetical protein PSV09DRAFT_1161007 [Bipolaris maydis]